MTTIAASDAAQQLDDLLQRALAGEVIKIEVAGQVVELRPNDDEYALRE